MRGQAPSQFEMLTPATPEHFVPRNHPLRRVKELADAALARLSDDFEAMYSKRGRRSIPPEYLLKAMLLMAFFSVRSERQLCEQLRYNLLFKWFLDMNVADEPFDHSVFTKNRERLMNHDVARQFFDAVKELAENEGLMSSEHFSVDGTLIQAWGSMKSFRPKEDDVGDNNGFGDFKGTKRKNDTHESKTDPEAKLRKKGAGQEAKLSYGAHALTENRNGLLVGIILTAAVGVTEPEVGKQLLDEALEGKRRATVGGDAGYNTKDFVEGCRERGVTPHVAGKKKGDNLDQRTRRHPGYEVSQRKRKRIEQVFGWAKTIGGLGKCRLRGIRKNDFAVTMVGAAYNLIRIAKLSPA